MGEVKQKKKWSVLVLLAMAAFVLTIDATAMNVSISYLVRDLDTTLETIQKIMAMYTLIMAACMLPSAKLADRFGAKRIFIIGVFGYGVGTLVAALAVNSLMLFVGWSLIEGIAAAMMMPTALSLVSSSYQGKDRTIALSVYMAMASVGIAVGPILGGLVTTYLSWRLVFALEVLIVIRILMGLGTIRSIPVPEGDRRVRIDVFGAVLSMTALPLFIFGCLNLQAAPTMAFVMMAASALLLAAFFLVLAWKRKRNKPVLLDISVFRFRPFNAALTINILTQLVLVGLIFVLSVYLQNILMYSALETGLTLVPLSMLLMAAALMISKLTTFLKPGMIVSLGGFLMALGILIFIFQTRGSDLATGIQMILPLVLTGLGVGCVLGLTSNLGLEALGPEYSNQGSGVLTTVNNLGSSMSTALLGTLFLARIRPGISQRLIELYPDQLGGMSVAEVSEALRKAFSRFESMDPDLSGISPSDLSKIKEALIYGVNHSLTFVLGIMMLLALLAAVTAFLFLRDNREPKATQMTK